MLLIDSVSELVRLVDVEGVAPDEEDEECLGRGRDFTSGPWYIYDGDEWYPFPDNWRF